MRTRILAAAIASATVVALAGCGAPANDGEVTLTVAGWQGEGTNEGGVPELIEAFEAAHPDITVDFTYVDNANYATYMNPRLAAGDGPDVTMVDTVKMRLWASQGFLADLSDQPWVSRQVESFANTATLDGTTYQSINSSTPAGLFVNVDLLKANGIDEIPTDWPSFTDALTTLKDAGAGGLIVAEKNKWAGSVIGNLIASNSVPSDWAQAYDAGTETFEAWSTALERFKELLDTGLVDPALSLGLDENVDASPQFLAGNWAFMPQGSWALSDLRDGADFELAFIPFPAGDAGETPKTFAFTGVGWAVTEGSENAEAAKEFVDFLTQPEQAEAYLVANSATSTFTDVSSPDVAEMSAVAEAATRGDVLPYALGDLNVADSGTPFGDAIVLLFLDPSTSIDTVIEQLDDTITPTPPGAD